MASIEKRGNAYLVRVSCGFSNFGKRIVKTKTIYPPTGLTEKQAYKEVQKEAVKFEEECKIGYHEKKTTFAEIANEWINNEERLRIKPSSLRGLEVASKTVDEFFGNINIEKITTRDIQKFISILAGGNPNKKPLSTKTIKNYIWYLSGAMKYAVRVGIIPANPCDNVLLPRAPRNSKRYYSLEDVKSILSTLEEEPITYKTFFYLAAYSGLRRGELLGLRWEDIDFEKSTVSVNRTMLHLSGLGTVFQSTKTKSSERTIKIPPRMVAKLKELKEWQISQKKELGNVWEWTDSLFTNSYGVCMGYNTPYNWLKSFCTKNGIEFKAIHVFRHFVASWLIGQGIDVQSVSGVLGHSSTSTTLSTYSHAFADARNIASDAMNKALGAL